ncbi:nucleoside transporter-domain-containing protein [Hygrophoropsis aurantiaca]|uniref:Nucleoside transporter-domain-containing protein n=1 Tax=Hygrophoropsis aurantiaca TaxID=72124 RepID=A0ACB8A938_9AGAM|nr:nucleoside transporter-domain-containing protein [Hygrophoropsis aurantiaca]
MPGHAIQDRLPLTTISQRHGPESSEDTEDFDKGFDTHSRTMFSTEDSEPIVVGDSDCDYDSEPSGIPYVTPPLDVWVAWIYFMLGCTFLLSWNVLITATPFFLARLDGSALRGTFTSYMSIAITASGLIFLAHSTATSKQSSSFHRIIISSIWLSVLMFLLFLSTFIHSAPGVFFAFVILNGIMQAGCASHLGTAIYAEAALLGSPCVQALMTGQAAVAVVVSGVQFISAVGSTWNVSHEFDATVNASDGIAEEHAARVLFGTSAAFIIATTVVYAWSKTLPLGGMRAGETRQARRSTDTEELRGLISATPVISLPDNKSQLMRVFKANFIYEFSGAYVYVVTLAVFPPITIAISSTNPSMHPLLFSAIHFIVFNVGDLLGRHLCSYQRFMLWSERRVLIITLLRTLFIPLFLVCNVQRPSSAPVIPPIITSDFLFMLILGLFGVSNGYVSTLSMLGASSLDHNARLKGRQEDVDVAATVANFCVNVGLAVGSMASFAARGAICDCNPFIE